VYEQEDLAQVVDQMRSELPELARQIVLFGLSMGAAAAGGAATLREGIAGVIMDSPYADVREAAPRHGWLFGLPGSIVQRPASWLIGWMAGADLDAISPKNLVSTVPCPVLLIQSGEDQFVSAEGLAEMERRVRERRERDGVSTALTVLGAAHLLGLSAMPQEYERALAGFLQQTMPNDAG
jgi:fermentation-respiration switch protein FrsA (DUF1100 family)